MPAWRDVPHEVLLFNFGGPERAEDVEPFLRRLFEDPFIIRTKMPEGLRRWLAKRIAKKRGPRVAHDYAKIGYSPINRTTNAVAARLEGLLDEVRPGTKVRVVNRYTPPFADEVVAAMAKPGASRVFFLSLYPHICHSTTVSSYRDFDLAYRKQHGETDCLSTRVFSWWFAPSYMELTARKLREGIEGAIAKAPGQLVQVIVSAHGLPQRYYLRGDPYVNEIRANFLELQRRTETWLERYAQGAMVGRVKWHLSFQSRVGPVEWVRPYTEETIVRTGREGGGVALLVPISFTADHIETLYEMDVTYQDQALQSGYVAYHRVQPANDDPLFAESLREILESYGF